MTYVRIDYYSYMYLIRAYYIRHCAKTKLSELRVVKANTRVVVLFSCTGMTVFIRTCSYDAQLNKIIHQRSIPVPSTPQPVRKVSNIVIL